MMPHASLDMPGQVGEADTKGASQDAADAL